MEPALKDADGLIELRLSSVSQLFNSLDPAPFHERDLDDDAEAYILAWARELPTHAPLHIVLDLPEVEAQRARELGIQRSISNYFATRARIVGQDLRELFHTGRRNLSISLPLLVSCLLLSQYLRGHLGDGALQSVIQESLVILGWVANWRPIEIFLYDWWPLARRRDLLRRLAAAPVEIRAFPSKPG